jgi:hypothetical protein
MSDKPRRAATIQYCQPYVSYDHPKAQMRHAHSLTIAVIQIRPVENQFLSVDLRRLAEIPEPITKMMGYGIQRPFIGYGTSSHLIHNII